MAGRPKSFDPEVALERAMELFWLQGYEATGLKQLLPHMGIGYQSLYDTYGNKHSLYVQALKRYSQQGIERLQEQLEAPGSPLGNIRRVVERWEDRAARAPKRGCFVNNSVAELSQHDPVVAEVAQAHLTQVEAAYRQALERAQAAGELSAGAGPQALARFLVMAAQGLILMGQANVGREALHDMVQVILSTLG